MDVSKLTKEELIFHLLTPDGRGKKVKQECLDVLLENARQKGYNDGSDDGYKSGWDQASFRYEDS